MYCMHQMKDMNVLYLLVYFILRESEEVEDCVYNLFYHFLIIYISTNFVLKGLKIWMNVTNIRPKATVSQIFLFRF